MGVELGPMCYFFPEFRTLDCIKEPVKQVTFSACTTHVLLENGDLMAWGSGEFGGLGNGSMLVQHLPIKIQIDSL